MHKVKNKRKKIEVISLSLESVKVLFLLLRSPYGPFYLFAEF